jgi:2-oxoglutarate ferredoxin oxidoreductase subunit alpha
MTPVILLSDGYIANGAEPWKYPESKDLPPIEVKFKTGLEENEEVFQPYLRNENLVRAWAIPGFAGLEHRVGGLEKEDITGNVSYDPENHQRMVKLRQGKIDKIADDIPEQIIDNGPENGKVLVIGWGSTYGAIKSAVAELLLEGFQVSHIHIRYVRPFPKNLGSLIKNFEKVLIPELNNGQLVKIIRDQYLVDAKGFNKIMGIPFTKQELVEEIKKML